MSNSQNTSRRDPFKKEELEAYRARVKFGIFRGLRAFFRRRQNEAGLTQKEVARLLGTDEALISKRLKGEANLTLDTLCDLARSMGARLDVKVTPLQEVTPLHSGAMDKQSYFVLGANFKESTAYDHCLSSPPAKQQNVPLHRMFWIDSIKAAYSIYELRTLKRDKAPEQQSVCVFNGGITGAVQVYVPHSGRGVNEDAVLSRSKQEFQGWIDLQGTGERR